MNDDDTVMSKPGQELLSETLKLKASKDGFSEKELKKARKALKKAGVEKPWLIKLTNDLGEELTFEL